MANQQDPWNSQQRPLGQPFNRQHPPVLPPPATLETGGNQNFYPLPSLASLGNGGNHPQPGHGFSIPSINSTGDNNQINQIQNDPNRQNQELRRPSIVNINSVPTSANTVATTSTTNQSNQLPPPSTIAQVTGTAVPDVQSIAGIPNRSTTTNVYRPLNVKDALSYLDQVKIQFYNQAEVYNKFLDIMKDFKSQSIDTPGVIDRVSNLFRGHPNLIQGFNTFLPPGYRIECSLDPSDPNPIRVTTPTGTTTRPNMDNSQLWGSDAPNQHQQQQQQLQVQAHYQQEPQLLQEEQGQGGGQIEFNHAISYVNKIKTRFANQPDIYKQFLEILQTYQREQKPISEVYEQVTVLFANSPDLLDDFKQFLPDTSSQSYQQQQQAQQQQLQHQQLQQQQTQQQQQQRQEGGFYGGASQLPPVGNFQQPTTAPTSAGPYNNAQQYNQVNYQHSSGSPEPHVTNTDVNDIKKKKSVSESYAYENNYNEEAQLSGVRGTSQKASSKTPVATKNGSVAATVNPTLVPGIPEPIPPSANVSVSSLSEEISFFDKVKKAIGNKQTYNDFLKILNLFSQDIIDKNTLIERVDGFFGDTHPELLNWFKMFVGFEEKPLHIENITFKKHQLELSLCKAYGPSYRQLPKAETYMPCSGRDEMCWEVLNDEWVGHPTWASEDSGFIAHRKNQYEDILFKIEEERLEFDYYMESNLRTIQTLETIANRIANMTPEQKANFKLPPGLGHNSITIYKKVLRKVYDRDRGFEVIDALHENPSIAVPIVLKRLKQKDEEWKRAQREWNKVWREMEQKVFFKSLDHLGLSFKQADKKLLTAKQLVSEISTVKVEQQNKRLHPLTPKPQEQLQYSFDDIEVLFDILKLADVFINRSSNYSSNDREKLTQFFQFFISLFFGISTETVEEGLASRGKTEKETEETHEPSKIDAVEATNENVSSKKRGRESDLLRNVLKKQSKSKKDDRADSPTPQVQDNDEHESLEEVEKSSELWIKTANTKFSLKEDGANETKRDKYNFFCNTTVYVFFRHLRTLYERLLDVKKMNDTVSKEIKTRKHPQFAKDLNLLPHQLEDMGIEIVGTKNCYKQVLELSEKLIDNELDHQWFEETLRQGYRNKAYKLYTVDKVVQAMVKHMHTMITDSKTSEIMVLFETDRTNPTSTAKDQILNRMQVRSLMASDEHMFKIVFKESDRSVNIQFVGLDDLTINDHENAEERYNYYVTSYIMSHPTEGVPASKINMPFSRTFIESVDEEQCVGRSYSGLKVSVCENSYRLFFDPNTHDEFVADSVYNKKPEDAKKVVDKVDVLKNFVNDEEVGWKRNLSETDDATKLDQKVAALFESGIKAYKDFSVAPEPVIASEKPEEKPVAAEATTETTTAEVVESDSTSKAKVNDAEATVIENNDTTIQQDANDATSDETTVNHDETSFSVGEQADSSITEK
ncbi:hypothetical protein DFJ63DRAFT_175977 [Scheffersomyces coipomensis]|uniref:uncharacterized protein n=1 Tax=Scheffersomyces coipomensis TaxID=1788519 RepID=UPI00315D33F0